MRIVAGKFGGRRLHAPRGSATRPTADRVREALFSILFDVEGAAVLDVFAGTGALGIEALSRGAKSATFIEDARSACQAIEKNLADLGLGAKEASILKLNADRALERLSREGRRFDLVFADPPYREASVLIPRVLTAASSILSTSGRIVIEQSSADEPSPPPPGLRLTSLRRYGETALAFYEPEMTQEIEGASMKLVNRTRAIMPPATLTLAQKARELAESGKDVVNLTTGEPDFPTPKHIVEAMKRALDRGDTRYTAVSGLPELRRAIAERFRTEGLEYALEEIVVSTGAKQCVMSAVQCLVEEGDEAIIVAPYWLSYVDMVRFAGGRAVIVETTEATDFLMTPAQLEAAITTKTKLLILNSPSNPAGALYDEAHLARFAEILKRHPQITVVSDEIYDCFVYGAHRYASLLRVAPELKDRVLVINGCSKRYAMTGLRIGWAAGPRALIGAVTRVQGQTTSNACSIAQHGAIAALTGDQSPVATMAEAYDTRRKFVVGRLRAIPGVECFDPRGAFYVLPNLSRYVGRTLPDGSTIDDASSIAAHLLHDHALVVVPGAAFGAPAHIRLSFATSMETLAKGLDRLQAALTRLG